MKRLLAAVLVVAVVTTSAVLSRSNLPPAGAKALDAALRVDVEDRNPWNHLNINNAPSTFRFAIVTDRTGGARAGVFERAVDQLNMLQPEFIVSVGDLIQGYSEKEDALDKQWSQFNGFINKLEMPFFYVPGNHDITNKAMENLWQKQFGRAYFHFVYKNTLFLILNSEDPPGKKLGSFSKEQIAWAQKVLAANADVRWTIVLLHKPVWMYAQVDQTGWLDIEQALNGRRYTVFAGHEHRYKKYLRNGQNYYMLATTGGGSKLRGIPQGEFDHIVWVTMKDTGPVLANLMMEGIFSDELTGPEIPLTGQKDEVPGQEKKTTP